MVSPRRPGERLYSPGWLSFGTRAVPLGSERLNQQSIEVLAPPTQSRETGPSLMETTKFSDSLRCRLDDTMDHRKFATLSIASAVLVTIAFTEATDGFRHPPWSAERSAFPGDVRPFGVSLVQAKFRRLRPGGIPDSTSRWRTKDAFPELDELGGAMQLVAHPTMPNCWYVATFQGAIHQVRRLESHVEIKRVTDLSSADFGWLYSFALHPDFGPKNRTAFVFYRSNEEAKEKYYRVSKIRLFGDEDRNAVKEDVLIHQQVKHYEHLGGALDFDDFGCLLIAVGDNGRYNDMSANSQKIDVNLFSGILRIDVDKRGGEFSYPSSKQPRDGRTGGYFVPKSNPFVGHPGALTEFWSIGFRSPFRMNYDGQTSTAWVGEVGQDRVEQVEAARTGTNHLWSFKEGTLTFSESYLKGERPRRLLGRATYPHYEYLHEDQDYCVVGGPIYRAKRYPSLSGKILIGDNQSGRVWALDSSPNPSRELLTRLPAGKDNASLTSISVDTSGRIFLTSFASGTGTSVHELVPDVPAEMPKRLSETAYFTKLTPLTPVDGFVDYEVNSPLWSDGMEKLRWFRVPEGQKIDNSNDPYGHWVFPEGSVFIKHFVNPASNDGDIETRILIRGRNGSIYGATYRWEAGADDAVLVSHREWGSISEVPENALVESEGFQYRFPGPNDCLVCHSPGRQSLGLTLAQLNRTVGGVNQVRSMSDVGMLKRPYSPEELEESPKLCSVADSSFPLEKRVRSYLQTNCSLCHREGGTQRTYFTADASVPLPEMGLVNVHAKTGYMEIDGRKTDLLIAPGRPEESLVIRRFRTHQVEYAMPYLGRRTVDRDALRVLSQWVQQMQ